MSDWMYAHSLPTDMHPQGCSCGGCSEPTGVSVNMKWRTEYVARDEEHDFDLVVRCPNDMGWFWAAHDLVAEESYYSGPEGCDSKEAAMEAVTTWFNTVWLPHFQATGERDLS